jgi:hypothetical protein
MELPSYFCDFLAEIRPQSYHVEDYKRGHTTLRDRLQKDANLAQCIVSTFLQGSYRRATAIRPQGDNRADVDIVVVTKLSQQEYTPSQALEAFVPFLNQHYKGKYRIQGRSIGIEMSHVDMDLVITAAPSKSEEGILESASVTSEDTLEEVSDWRLTESWVPLVGRSRPGAARLLEKAQKEPEWKTSPLYIPDREAHRWEPTDPLAQIKWTSAKNNSCNGHYVNVVKAIKWWWRLHPTASDYPKGYPVEHMVGFCCPDGIQSVAEGVTRALETIVSNYRGEATSKTTPFLPDHGVPEHNVFGRVSGEDFAAFYDKVSEAAEIARDALDESDLSKSVTLWQTLFENRFPDAPPDKGGDRGYTPRTDVSTVRGARFA